MSCAKKEQDPFEIAKQNVGLLTDSTQVKDLDMVFVNDSISRYIGGDEFTGNINNIEIYEKGGKHLLTLTPSEALDSTAVISTIRIEDERYKTDKLLSKISTFKDINENYKINKINNLIKSVVISVNELNASFTIDKEELPANLRFDMNIKFDPIQIPDNAKIKYFMLHW
ncbi:hypothetical protein RM697_13375 [Ichthyenterobacterium sp. W332]|uniref:Uncharacterized protein n=1 Tax=Microcosmobacter mediterraneus TaxID=3075607 RepID=A0ABU2YQU1_9FLAO|nr:hypothetical protein [Ichthyenterobacterium sp. W332]MDT0559645.1 hypothetical protein [Ichthyenterobacterium sp. W332]